MEGDATHPTAPDDTLRPVVGEARDSLLILAVAGMHCHACEARVVATLATMQGVVEAEVDFPSGQASVIFDARRVSASELMDAVREAGYRVGEYHLGRGVPGS